MAKHHLNGMSPEERESIRATRARYYEALRRHATPEEAAAIAQGGAVAPQPSGSATSDERPTIPDNYSELPWAALRALAIKLGASAQVTKEEALSLIADEVEQRSKED